MNKVIGAAILVAGLFLLYFGWAEYNSTASELKEAVTGSPTDNAMWYLIGGAIAVVIGIGAMLKGRS